MEKLIDVSNLIAEFRDVILKAWPNVEALAKNDSTESLKNDWLQSCWERLVEHSLFKYGLIRLEVYGEGADINGSSSRVSFPDDQVTHQVRCIPSIGGIAFDVLNDCQIQFQKNSGYLFDRFASIRDGWYYDTPPFDHVVLDNNGSEAVIKLSEVRFILIRKLN